MADIEKSVKASTELVGVSTILGVNLTTVKTIQDVVAQTTKNGHKPHRSSRRFPTAKKTTTPEGKREYQRWLMRERNGSPPSRWKNHKPLSGIPDPFDFGKKRK